jgi:pentatricopeptide repeat protein
LSGSHLDSARTSAGKKEKAEKLLREMRKHGFKPSVPLYKSIMSLSAALKDEAAIDSLYELLKEDYDVKRHLDEVYVTAIHAYGKLKSFAKCEDFIEEIREKEMQPSNGIYRYVFHFHVGHAWISHILSAAAPCSKRTQRPTT